eukprot:Gregarina_sp_Pseudo_9__5559@NODE_742_length_2284_cov_155_865033_g698_i0_p1_GENE_NODE_742_length_2284_cov_155_865033_g698_i0NODE_742_length_2284_cov_155_865033_g698_i0_p1_ORF_typecomplete_len363_score6_69AOX/PF01786_17/7_3e73_NODE_742_length_2284_cov_155_865033_g698_i011242212
MLRLQNTLPTGAWRAWPIRNQLLLHPTFLATRARSARFLQQEKDFARRLKSSDLIDKSWVLPKHVTCSIASRWTASSSKRNLSSEDLHKAAGHPPKHFMSKDSLPHRLPPTDIAKCERKDDWTSETKVTLPHPVWSEETVKAVRQTHFRPNKFVDMLAFAAVKGLRASFDLISGYSLGFVDEQGWLNRIIFLETVAGVPGLVAAMCRHLRSLRRMDRDYGWIHTLLEEAENERMHLMTALQLKQPGLFFRLFVLFTQGVFLPCFLTAYVCSPRFAHRFVGYLEEEAVKTYTKLLDCLSKGKLPVFNTLKAPLIARQYWELSEDASFEDLILAIRADESHHRDVNHTFASMRRNDPNPFAPGA